jgi:hypothetical protein
MGRSIIGLVNVFSSSWAETGTSCFSFVEKGKRRNKEKQENNKS